MEFHRSLPALSLAALLAVGCSGSGDPSSPGGPSSDESEHLTDAGIESLNEATSDALLEAIELFEEALEADSENDVARSLLAMSKVLAFLDAPNTSSFLNSGCGMDLKTLLDRLDMDLGEGTTIFTILDGTDSLPNAPESMPSDPPTGTEFQSFLRCELIPLLQDTAEKLENVSPLFTHEFEEGLLGSEPFTLDYVDVHIIAGVLRGVEMLFHEICLFKLAFDPEDAFDEGGSWGPGMPTQLFTGNDPFDVEAERLCYGNTGLFNAHALLDTAGLLDASDEAQTHLDEWRAAGVQLLQNINDAVDGKVALEEAGAEPGLIGNDPDLDRLICAQAFWSPWLFDMQDALNGVDYFVHSVKVWDSYCYVSIDLPELDIPPEVFDAATYSNRPFLPTYEPGHCYFVDENSFRHLSSPVYANLHAIATHFGGTLDEEDMSNFWHDMECAFQESIGNWCR